MTTEALKEEAKRLAADFAAYKRELEEREPKVVLPDDMERVTDLYKRLRAAVYEAEGETLQ